MAERHTLRNEGAAHVWWHGQPVRARYSRPGTGGGGMALCSCGATSPILPSGNARKRWHREHKAQMREASGG